MADFTFLSDAAINSLIDFIESNPVFAALLIAIAMVGTTRPFLLLLCLFYKAFRKHGRFMFFALAHHKSPHPATDFILASLVLAVWVFFMYNPHTAKINLFDLSFICTQIIGILIAIIFSFSIFTTQRKADLSSAEYKKPLAGHREIMSYYMPLASLIFVSFFIPVLFSQYSQYPKFAFWALLSVLLLAFFFVYRAYVKLAEKSNPLYILQEMESVIFKNLKDREKAHEQLCKNEGFSNLFRFAAMRLNEIHEIGERLLDRHEFDSFKQVLCHLRDVYSKHLILGDGYFISNRKHLHYIEDKWLIFHLNNCLLVLGKRLVKEERESAAFFLLVVFNTIAKQVLCVKYADNAKENVISASFFFEYEVLVKKIFALDSYDLNLMTAENLLRLSKIIIQKVDDSHAASCPALIRLMKMAADHYPDKEEEFDPMISKCKDILKKES